MYHKYTLTYQKYKKKVKNRYYRLCLIPLSKIHSKREFIGIIYKKYLRSEIQNSLIISGLPPHKLVLKVNCIVLSIRNLNTKEALVNGTRMRIKFMHRNAINCEVLTGTERNKRILIPRKFNILLFYHLTFQGTQFPIIPAFDKSQKQTFEKIGILLRQPVFTHGQLYVAASSVRSFNGLRFYISEYNGQGHLPNDERVFTKNIVYTEVLNH
jgi:ATP-dependent DNA helicase PIF1